MKKLGIVAMLLTACFSESDMLGSTTSSSSGDSSSSTSEDLDSSGSSTGNDESTSAAAETSTTHSGVDSTTGTDDGSSESSTGDPITDFALYFGGDGQLVSDEAIDLQLGQSYTVEAWIRIDSTDAHGPIVVHRGVGTTGWSLQVSSAPSAFIFGFFDNNGTWTDLASSDLSEYGNGWHHVAAVKDMSTLHMYVDGNMVASKVCPSGVSAPSVEVQIGTNAGGSLLSIAVDDVRISEGARYEASFKPQAEIEADLLTRLLLVLDEGVGLVASDDGPDAWSFSTTGTLWVAGNTEI